MITVKFHSHHRRAKVAPNPKHPSGIDIDLAPGVNGCTTRLPYPAECCGVWLVRCSVCETSAAITAAGRADDPRSVKLACKHRTHA